jgi:hypothetical protein
MKNFWKSFMKKTHDNNERGARETVLEELFNDFNRNRFTIYKFNFMRGIFFGLGSVLGGTVVIALIVWILNGIGWLVPGLAGFLNDIVHMMDSAAK